MIKMYSGLLAVCLLSGCASVQINGIVNDACLAQPAAGDKPRMLLARGDSAAAADMGLLWRQKPKPGTLKDDITSASIAAGLQDMSALRSAKREQRLVAAQQAAGLLALDADHLAHWAELLELEPMAALHVPSSTAEAARGARSFLAEFWGQAEGIRQIDSGSEGKPFGIAQIRRKDLEKFASAERVALQTGFEALAAHDFGQLARHADAALANKALGRDSAFLAQVAEQAKDFSAAAFASLYLKAYFRGGRVLQVQMDADAIAAKLDAKVDAGLKGQGLTEEDRLKVAKAIKEALKGELESACREDAPGASCLLTRAWGTESLVTRSGMKLQYAGMSVEIGKEGKATAALTYPPSTEVAPQVVRVLTEAVFDAFHTEVPAVADATACKAGKLPCMNDEQKERVEKMDGYGSKAEALVSSAAGKVFRGANLVALNNEAIAKSLETLAGVTARKWLEKALWTRYANGTCKSGMVPAAAVSVAP